MFSDVAGRAPRVRRSLVLGILLLSACTPAPESPDAAQTDTAADANVAASRRLAEESWNNKNLAVLAELHAPDVVSYTNGVRDTLTAEAMMRATQQQYPDARVEIVELFGVGDRVVSHWTWTATAVPSTNQTTIHGASIQRWANGKLAESHSFYDLLGATLATGATVTPPAAPTTTTGQ